MNLVKGWNEFTLCREKDRSDNGHFLRHHLSEAMFYV